VSIFSLEGQISKVKVIARRQYRTAAHVVVVVIVHQPSFLVRDDTRKVTEGDTESFAAVVLDELSSGTDRRRHVEAYCRRSFDDSRTGRLLIPPQKAIPPEPPHARCQ